VRIETVVQPVTTSREFGCTRPPGRVRIETFSAISSIQHLQLVAPVLRDG